MTIPGDGGGDVTLFPSDKARSLQEFFFKKAFMERDDQIEADLKLLSVMFCGSIVIKEDQNNKMLQ